MVNSSFLRSIHSVLENISAFVYNGGENWRSEEEKADKLESNNQNRKKVDRSGADRVTVTDDIRRSLRAHKARSGFGTTRLLRGLESIPPGLNPQIIESWIRGDAKTARRDHLRFVLAEWDRKLAVEIVEITPAFLSALLQEKERTGYGAIRLLRDTPGKPDGLTKHMVEAWLAGGTRSARTDHVEFVLQAWRSKGTRKTPKRPRRNLATNSDYVILLPKDREYLLAQKNRTGRGTHSLLATAPDVPDGLTPRVIQGWLDGRCRKARKAHLAYVRKLWRRLPTSCW